MVDDDSAPVIQRLKFGERAREYREAAGIEFGEADRALSGYSGKLSKIETGIIAAKPPDVELMIELYGIGGRDADDFRALAAEGRKRSAPEKVSSTSRQYVALERVASEIRIVFNEIPGLLQTKDYAYAALSRSPTVAAGEAYGQAEAREQRSLKIVRPGGPDMWIALGIEALYREVGGPDVLCRQLERLREIADMPNVWFRILPWSAGAVPALSCPFTLLYIKPARTVAYVTSLTRPDYVRATGPYLAAFELAWQLATPEDEARSILERRISELSQGS